MKKLAILAIVALAALGLTAYAIAAPAPPRRGGGALGPPDTLEAANPAGIEIDLPATAMAPEQNPLWNGDAPGLSSDGPGGDHAQGPPVKITTDNRAGHTVDLPEQSMALDKNPLWNGDAPGLSSDGPDGDHAQGPPEKTPTVNPADHKIELPGHAEAVVSEKNPHWGGGAPGAENRQGLVGDHGQGPREKQEVCHKPGTPAEKTLKLPRPAAEHHTAKHGDTANACPS